MPMPAAMAEVRRSPATKACRAASRRAEREAPGSWSATTTAPPRVSRAAAAASAGTPGAARPAQPRGRRRRRSTAEDGDPQRPAQLGAGLGDAGRGPGLLGRRRARRSARWSARTPGPDRATITTDADDQRSSSVHVRPGSAGHSRPSRRPGPRLSYQRAARWRTRGAAWRADDERRPRRAATTDPPPVATARATSCRYWATKRK